MRKMRLQSDDKLSTMRAKLTDVELTVRGLQEHNYSYGLQEQNKAYIVMASRNTTKPI